MVYALQIDVTGVVHDLVWDDLNAAIQSPVGIFWLHFDASNSYVKQWIINCPLIPPIVQDLLLDSDDRPRFEIHEQGIAGIMHDMQYSSDYDLDQIATLRFYLHPTYLISTRHRPLATTDKLHALIRQKQRFNTTASLLVHLFDLQTETMDKLSNTMSREISKIEDRVLTNRIDDQRLQLGAIRRLSTHMVRHFAPEYRLLIRQTKRLPIWFEKDNKANFKEVMERFSEVIRELEHLNERAKMLQEELSARLSEQTNRNLFVLSILTALFLPVNLITGIFGMNVAGLPGLENPSAFIWVIVMMGLVTSATLMILRWLRIL